MFNLYILAHSQNRCCNDYLHKIKQKTGLNISSFVSSFDDKEEQIL